MRKCFTAAAVFVVVVSNFVGAQAASTYVPKGMWDTLVRDGKIEAVSFDAGKGLSLVPAHPFAEQLKTMVQGDKANVFVERLCVLKRTEPADGAGERLGIYNILRSVSSLEGIEYWSESRKAMRTLYAKSYRIEDTSSRKKLPDPLAKQVFPRDSFLVLQEDLTFGANCYRITLLADETAFIYESVNVTAMWYGIIQAVGEGSLHTRVLIVPCDDYVIFYAVSTANASVFPGVQDKLKDSFGNRAQAIFDWFRKKTGELYAVLK